MNHDKPSEDNSEAECPVHHQGPPPPYDETMASSPSTSQIPPSSTTPPPAYSEYTGTLHIHEDDILPSAELGRNAVVTTIYIPEPIEKPASRCFRYTLSFFLTFLFYMLFKFFIKNIQ